VPDERHIEIPIGADVLPGDLALPSAPIGVVAFAHGSGSSRHSPRNRAVAAALQREGLATLLVDLLTPTEEEVDRQTAALRFDLALLADRLAAVVRSLGENSATERLPLGLFGASTGAGAALIAAADAPDRVRAVVSRGGRPDLAGDALERVRCPTLLLVGSRDERVLDLNERARQRLRVETELAVIPGATHLFEEPGALDEVARLAAGWFRRHLPIGR
jgi:pimeloyl-ACP methyl ester carboxylesterase